MSERRSRTYRLRLSHDGTQLFLRCHCRLAHLTGSLISYGSTLFVAVLIARRLDAGEMSAEFDQVGLTQLTGDTEHFVGASERLGFIASEIDRRLEGSENFDVRPKRNMLFTACIAIMASSEDRSLRSAYADMHRVLSRD